MIEEKEDGLNYAYRYRMSIRKYNPDSEEYFWVPYGTHYNRLEVYRWYSSELQYADTTSGGLVVEEYIDNTWVVCIDWLERFLANNRRNIIWEINQI